MKIILQDTLGAMAASRQKLLDKLLRFREGELKDYQGAKDKLEEIHKFLTDHETVSPSDCTHEILNGFGDWWVSQKSTKRLGIAKDNTVDAFYKHIATMYEMGVPLTLGEKRTPQFKLLQDIEIRGTKNDYVKPKELIGDQKALQVAQSPRASRPSMQAAPSAHPPGTPGMQAQAAPECHTREL